MAIDYRLFPLAKKPSPPKSEVKKDGRLVLNKRNYQKLRLQMWEPGIICELCGYPILYFYQFTLEHYDGRGHGGGRRDDRKVVPAHWNCNVAKGSKRI